MHCIRSEYGRGLTVDHVLIVSTENVDNSKTTSGIDSQKQKPSSVAEL